MRPAAAVSVVLHKGPRHSSARLPFVTASLALMPLCHGYPTVRESVAAKDNLDQTESSDLLEEAQIRPDRAAASRLERRSGCPAATGESLRAHSPAFAPLPLPLSASHSLRPRRSESSRPWLRLRRPARMSYLDPTVYRITQTSQSLFWRRRRKAMAIGDEVSGRAIRRGKGITGKARTG